MLTRRGRRLWWQPTDWSEPFNQFVPKYQVGSTFPAFYVATELHELARECGVIHAVAPERPLPVALHAWRSGGLDHVLVGNLETGEFGDSRLGREVTIRLPVESLALSPEAAALELVDGDGRRRSSCGRASKRPASSARPSSSVRRRPPSIASLPPDPDRHRSLVDAQGADAHDQIGAEHDAPWGRWRGCPDAVHEQPGRLFAHPVRRL